MTSSTSSFKELGAKALLWILALLAANLIARKPVARLIERPVSLEKNEIARSVAPVVVLGDSHSGAIGTSDDQLLNLSQGGDSFAEMRAKLDYLLRQGYQPRKVILQLGWHSFSSCRRVRNNRQQGELFTDAKAFQEIYGGSRWRFWLRSEVYARLPLLNPVNARLARRYLVHSASPEESSASWNALSSAERGAQCRERLIVHYSLPYDNTQVEQVRAIVKLCRDHNIELVGIRLPLYAEFYSLVASTDEYRMANKALAELDLRIQDWSQSVQDVGLFINQDHLRPYSAPAVEIREALVKLEDR